jgi:hypothetical protein
MRRVSRWVAFAIAVPLLCCSQPRAASPAPATTEAASVSPSASAPASPTPSAEPSPSPTPEAIAVLVAAGDIASCEETGDSATAAVIAGLGDDVTVATLGDNVYPAGGEATFAECYDPAWGEFRERTRPALGNHDVESDGGAAYHAYFGDLAGPPDVGWYSYDLADWHAIVLDSNCGLVGCAPGSLQHDWLVADLAATDSACVLAYWHHPRFTSGPHGDSVATGDFWEALHGAGAELVLVGHDHIYERFAPQAPDGSADTEHGIRQFTVGTGGAERHEAVRVAPHSELINDDAFGVLELTLHADAYDWRFLTVDGAEADAGSADCH